MINLGRDALSTVLSKSKNIDLVERYISEYTNNADEYLDLLYESIEILNRGDSKTDALKELLKNIVEGNIGWNNTAYNEFKQKIDEEDQFILNPIEIEEGVLECKCGSKRTISYQRQIRSADEGSTTFAQCVECGNRWRHNN